jgi:hypothetical protein
MASAQPGIAADRFAREIVPFLKARCGALAAAECQAVGRPSNVPLSRSSALLSGAVAHERRAVAMEPIERGMQARGASCGSSQPCLKVNAYEGPWCWVWYRQRGSAERGWLYPANAPATCLASAIYRRCRPTRRCS